MASTVRARQLLDIRIAAEEINRHVHEVVSLGSLNKGASSKAMPGFTALLKAITNAAKEKPKNFPKAKLVIRWGTYGSLLQQETPEVFLFSLPEIASCIKKQWSLIKSYMDPKELEDLMNNLRAIAPLLAFYQYQYDLPITPTIEEALTEARYNALFCSGVKDISDDDTATRSFF